ncbi:MAG: 50S ribosomal protein L4 [Patescibacteria group bacterium]
MATFTKNGTKATTNAKLDKSIFDLEVKNHELLKQAYIAYLANGRENLAVVKTRGEVSGGGRKPWKQKGTGRARFGSSRNPIWRGGGITFGPTGNENYSHKLSTNAKRQAIRQALSVCKDKVIIIETFECKDGLVKNTVDLLQKIGAVKQTLIVVSVKDKLVERATRNLQAVNIVQAKYLNVYDILNADSVVISQKSLPIISEWLGVKEKQVKEVSK